MRRWATMLAGLAAAIAGCTSSVTRVGDGAARAEVDGGYAEAFDAAKDIVRARGFTLDRVDAARGILTTLPRTSAGYATPWLDHATTAHDAWSGLVHHDERVVTVRFRPAGSGVSPPVWSDLRGVEGPWEVEVMVDLIRRYELDRRADPTSIRFTHESPGARTASGSERVRVGADFGLAQRLTDQIAAQTQTVATPPE